MLLTDQDIPVDIEPGGVFELPLFASVASCDPALGTELPPGDYLVVAEVSHIVQGADGAEILDLVSEPQPVTIAG